MKKNLLFVVLLSGLGLIWQSGCRRELNEIQADGNDGTQNEVALENRPVTEIFNGIQEAKRSADLRFDLIDPTTGNWKIVATRESFLADDFQAVTGEGTPIEGASKSDFLTLSGYVEGMPNSYVQIVMTRKWMEGVIHLKSESFAIHSKFSKRELQDGYYSVQPLVSLPNVPFVCGTPPRAEENTPGANNAKNAPLEEFESTATNCWKLQLRAHGDYEYFAGTANSDLNLASFSIVYSMFLASNYFQTINLDLDLGQVVVFQSLSNPLYYPTSTSMVGLLLQMSQFHDLAFGYPNSLFDGVVLFTGKRYLEAAGMAYMGAVCKYSGRYSYAVVGTRNDNGSNYSANMVVNIIGHELGHTLGAEHTYEIPSNSPCRSVPLGSDDLMWMQNGNSSNMGFHECARRQMNRHIWYNHSCMTMAPCE